MMDGMRFMGVVRVVKSAGCSGGCCMRAYGVWSPMNRAFNIWSCAPQWQNGGLDGAWETNRSLQTNGDVCGNCDGSDITGQLQCVSPGASVAHPIVEWCDGENAGLSAWVFDSCSAHSSLASIQSVIMHHTTCPDCHWLSLCHQWLCVEHSHSQMQAEGRGVCGDN